MKQHALITGANTGIGRITALELARQGVHLTLAARSRERTQSVIAEVAAINPRVRVRFEPIALDNLEDVRACAQRVLARGEALDLLINNAGLAGARGATREGFEMAFGVNHLGHFQLTLLLLEHLKAQPSARVVHVAVAHTGWRDQSPGSACAAPPGRSAESRSIQFPSCATFSSTGRWRAASRAAGFRALRFTRAWWPPRSGAPYLPCCGHCSGFGRCSVPRKAHALRSIAQPAQTPRRAASTLPSADRRALAVLQATTHSPSASGVSA